MKRALVILSAAMLLGCATPQKQEPEVPNPQETMEDVEPLKKKEVAEFIWDRFLDFLIVYPW